MLSGIGPAQELAVHGIPLRIDLPGVGRNLQDRYEVPVVNRMNFPQWRVFRGARFAANDPLFRKWQRWRQGPYITNGGVLAAFRRSFPDRQTPDIFCLAILGLFRGYVPGYSTLFAENLNYLTWVALKAHTANRAGRVTLRSADPRDPPVINFHYFDEGNDAEGRDIAAVVEGIRFVRKMTQYFKDIGQIQQEELPGDAMQSDEELAPSFATAPGAITPLQVAQSVRARNRVRSQATSAFTVRRGCGSSMLPSFRASLVSSSQRHLHGGREGGRSNTKDVHDQHVLNQR